MALAIVSVIHKATLRGGPIVHTTPKEGNLPKNKRAFLGKY